MPHSHQDKLLLERKKLVESLRLRMPHVSCIAPDSSVEFSVMVATKIRVMTYNELSYCLQIGEANKGQWTREEVHNCITHETNGDTKDILNHLGEIVKSQLSTYPTSVNEDEILLKSSKKPLSNGAQLAIQYRLNRKKLLK